MPPTAIPARIRFERYVDKTPGHGPQADCWLWTGKLTAAGCGQLSVAKQRPKRAHLLAFEYAFGRAPLGYVRQSCGLRACVRPDHLTEVAAPGFARAPLAERLWKYVDKTPGYGPGGDCWVWTGRTRASGGYGLIPIRIAGRPMGIRAHRLSFELAHGRAPHAQVLHRCDNPPCVNPAHLREGTNTDNVHDCVSRRRHCYGERSPRARLTDAKVLELRRLRAKGATYRELAERYGVHVQTIAATARGEHWKHLLP